MEVSFPKFGSVGLAVLSFFTLVNNTIIGDFFHWFPFGWSWFSGLIDFLVLYYPFLGAFFFAVIFLQWTKNVYILAVLGVFFIAFVKFGLNSTIGG